MDNRLMIFTKNPVLGTAKTRIGSVKGDEVALKVYQALLRYTRDTVSGLPMRKIVFFNRFLEAEGIWNPEEFQQKLQVEGDLGRKMAVAFKNEFEEEADSVVIIGSDCAELKAEDISAAFKILKHSDVVIGPAIDGGYYLLGMNSYYPQVFNDMPWSQAGLLDATTAQLDKDGLSYEILAEKSDIDFWEDWEKLGWPLD